MIPDIGWFELLIIAALAIIVVGPKDLPRMMRTLGRWLGKARAMAREFQRSFDDIAREAELDELRKEVASLKETNPIGDIKKSMDLSADLSALDDDLKKSIDDAHNPSKEDEEKEPAGDEAGTDSKSPETGS